MPNIPEISKLSTVSDIRKRANQLLQNESYEVFLSITSNFYLEIDFSNQLKIIGRDSGIGKTYMLTRFKTLLKNNAKFEINTVDLQRIKVILNPDELSLDVGKANMLLIDRGDMLNKEQTQALNKHLRNNKSVVLLARQADGVEAEIPTFEDDIQVKRIGGIDCFFIA